MGPVAICARIQIMSLQRASCQRSASLEGFYQRLVSSTDGISRSVGAQMLSLFPMLAEAFGPLDVWGLTSLHHLWLLAKDDYRSPWLVCITAIPDKGYKIEYKTSGSGLQNALVEGIAPDEATACRLILSAMKRSGGWPEQEISFQISKLS
jgi:hypothetical protein